MSSGAVVKEKCRVAVLVSGGGTNLQAIIDAERGGLIKSARVVAVVSNNKDAYALERAEKAGIKTAVVLKRDCVSQTEFEDKITAILEENKVELIVLAGFMSILSQAFTSRYPNRILNVHPSLIPKYCGKGFYGLKVHEAVLSAGEKLTGATVHFVNEIPDGGKIIAQREVEVKNGDTPQTLQRRVMEQAEWILLPAAIESVGAEIVNSRSQDGAKQL
jgi:phosphoribosylglycinamide formyltransferase-1